MSFCWVPAHVGIHGNERADRKTKIARNQREINVKAVPHFDMKQPIHKYILCKWQEWWSSPLANNKLGPLGLCYPFGNTPFIAIGGLK